MAYIKIWDSVLVFRIIIRSFIVKIIIEMMIIINNFNFYIKIKG